MEKSFTIQTETLPPVSVSRLKHGVSIETFRRFEFRIPDRIPDGFYSHVYLDLNTNGHCERKCWQTNAHVRFGHESLRLKVGDYLEWHETMRYLIPDVPGNTMPNRYEMTRLLADGGLLVDLNQIESSDFDVYTRTMSENDPKSVLWRHGIIPLPFAPRAAVEKHRFFFVEYQVDCCGCTSLLNDAIPTATLTQLVQEYAFYPFLHVSVSSRPTASTT